MQGFFYTVSITIFYPRSKDPGG